MKQSMSRMGIWLAVFATASAVQAANTTVIYDHFDNGVIGTNTLGIGTGFNQTAPTGSTSYAEAGSELTMTKLGGDFNTSGHFTQVGSKDQFDAFQIVPVTLVEWTISGGTDGLDAAADNRRVYLGVRRGTAAGGSDGSDPAQAFLPYPFSMPGGTSVNHGIWVSLATDDAFPLTPPGGAGAKEGQLLWHHSTGANTALATWDWNTFDLEDPVNLVLQLLLTSTTYELILSGTDSGITLSTGSLSGLLPVDSRPSAVQVGAFHQVYTPGFISGGDDLADFDMDLIRVVDDFVAPQAAAAVPEPASLAFLGLAGLMLMRRRR